jgi:protein TonB
MSAGIPSGLGRYEASDRVIGYAVLLSLLLHGALLFSFHMRPSKGRPAPLGPITAHLATPRAPAPQPESPKVEPRVEPQKVEPPKPRIERPVVKPALVAKPSPIPVPRPVPAAPTPPQPASAAPPQPSAPAAVAKAEPQPSTPAPGSAEIDSLQSYRSELIEMAKKYKRYPRVAMDNNWEGKVVVRLVIGANGMISAVQVLSSAGHEVLDKQAQEMVQRAKTLVQIPAALRGKEFVIEIPVTYELKEAG